MGTKGRLLPAVVSAIADSDNEIDGLILTRLREAFIHGRDDGVLEAAHNTWLQSPVDTFAASMVGLGVDILAKDGTTNEKRSFVVATYVNAKTVVLQGLDGSAPGFVNQTSVRWRFTTLRVETTLDFPTSDPLMRLWVGEELEPVSYAQVVQAVGVQEFRGIGGQTRVACRTDGTTHILTDFPVFAASMVGQAVWILPPSDDAGPRVITSYVSSREVAVSGTAMDADSIWLAIKDYSTGYVEHDQREQQEITEGSQSLSGLDKLRRAILINYADGDDLDGVGSNWAAERPRHLEDESYRRLIQVLAHLPRQTVTAIESVLDAFFPAGGWEVYEDLANHPCVVYITLPTVAPGSVYAGRWFFAERGEHTSSSATAVTIDHTPTVVTTVKVASQDQNLAMDVLPSADSPAWTYVNDGEIEGNTFGASGVLIHAQDRDDANGGRYLRNLPRLEPGWASISANFRLATVDTVGGCPWKMVLELGGREVVFMARHDHVYLGQLDETYHAGGNVDLTDGEWHRLELRVVDELWVIAFVDNGEIARAPWSDFSASGNSRAQFGYAKAGTPQNQDWLVNWDQVYVLTKPKRNHYNLRRDDGVLVLGNEALSSASALWVVGDTGKKIRLYGNQNKNNGLWRATYDSPGVILLSGIVRSWLSVETVGGSHYITADGPWFRQVDVDKTVTVSGSLYGNNGDVVVLEYISPWQLRVSRGSPFTAEGDLSWCFAALFASESGVRWELVNAASFAGANLTLRDALPETNTPVVVDYTTIPSGQLLLNEMIPNDNASPNLRYPAYLFDTDAAVKAVLDDVKAKGVILKYKRDW